MLLALLSVATASPLWTADTTLERLLAALGDQTGSAYAAGPEIADERLVVYVPRAKAAELPGMLARLLDCAWELRGGVRTLVSRRDYTWSHEETVRAAIQEFRDEIAWLRNQPPPTGDYLNDSEHLRDHAFRVVREGRWHRLSEVWQLALAHSVPEDALRQLVAGKPVVASTHSPYRDVALPGDASWYGESAGRLEFTVILRYDPGVLHAQFQYGAEGTNANSNNYFLGVSPTASSLRDGLDEPTDWNFASDERDYRDPQRSLEPGETVAQAMARIARDEGLACLAFSTPHKIVHRTTIDDCYAADGWLLVRGPLYHRARDLWAAHDELVARRSWPVLRETGAILDRAVSRPLPPLADVFRFGLGYPSFEIVEPDNPVLVLWNSLDRQQREAVLGEGVAFASIPDAGRFAVARAAVRRHEYHGTKEAVEALAALREPGCRISLRHSVREGVVYHPSLTSQSSGPWPPSQGTVAAHPDAPAWRVVTLTASILQSAGPRRSESGDLFLSQVLDSGTLAEIAGR